MPNDSPSFTTIPLDRGVTLHHHRSDRFKTEFVRVFIRAPLDDRRTLRHLFAALLSRGTQDLPTRRRLVSRLQDLYGAGYGAAAQSIAGRHVLALRASTVAGRFLPGRPENLKSLLAFLSHVLSGPPTGADGLPASDVFEQERRSLKRDLLGRVNNKARYALDRLHEEMYAGTPLAHPDIGTESSIDAATPLATLAEGMRTFSEGEIDVYLLAPCTAGQAERLVRRHFKLAPRRKERLRPLELAAPRSRVRKVREALDVEQGRLTLGFRIADWTPGEGYSEVVLANTILGGGPASKLFRNVREERSLCYDINSWLDNVSGTIGIQAGIRPENHDAALRAIRAEVRAMKRGRISDDEVALARAAILSSIRTVPDSPTGLIEFFYRRRLMKRRGKTLKAIVRGFERMSIDDIPALFERASLDTIFFLDREEPAHATA
ncbi:MAG: insulinase family protein [Planctomycetes bacterium]|nr:insulinase family protein [Planctomycetota bacterium]